jgi:ubiquinone/menaquinone biosynthesis C-methylase UbiE
MLKESLEYFLDNINDLKRPIIMKTDLWNESVLNSFVIYKTLKNNFKFSKIIFLDINKNLCIDFKKNRKKKEYVICGDISSLSFRKSSIDIIIDVSTSDHLSDKDFKKTIEEYFRVLKSNGYLIMFHLNGDYINISRHTLAENDFFPCYPRKEKLISNMLNNCGFNIIKKKYLYVLYDGTFIGELVNSLVKFFGYKNFSNLLIKLIAHGISIKYFSLQIGYLCKK